MWGVDRDAVICDLAETYNVLDYRSLPIMTLATLCAGLHEDSRIKMRLMELHKIAPSFAFVRIADTLTMILHVLANNKTKPKLYQDIMTGKPIKKSTTGFSSIEEFEKARKRFLNNV